jgi:hypothetical protein
MTRDKVDFQEIGCPYCAFFRFIFQLHILVKRYAARPNAVKNPGQNLNAANRDDDFLFDSRKHLQVTSQV